jgi:hypothetical protein
MSKPTLDIQLIELALKILQRDTDPALAAKREELGRIYRRISHSLSAGEGETAAAQLLPEYMRSNPEVMTALSEEVVREALSYVSGVCDYYRMLKAKRPLTDEEKDVGRQLSQLLRAAQDLI